MKEYTIKSIDNSIYIVVTNKSMRKVLSKARAYFGHGLFRSLIVKGVA